MKSLLLALVLVASMAEHAASVGAPFLDDTYDYVIPGGSPGAVQYFTSPVRSLLKTFFEVDPATGLATSYGVEVPVAAVLYRNGYYGNYVGPFGPSDPPPPPPTSTSYVAALPFDANAGGAGIPFTHVGFFYNPVGHPGGNPDEAGWEDSHYDVHFHYLSPYEVGNILCPEDNESFECAVNANNSILFARDSLAIPDEFTCDDFGVAFMGAHCYNNSIETSFLDCPAQIVGTYQGKLNFLEPMITLQTINETIGGTTCFPFPTMNCYRKEGLHPGQLCIWANDTTARIYFDNLSWKEADCDLPTYLGPHEDITTQLADGSVSKKKDCVVHHDTSIDAGFTVSDGEESYCCRSRGSYDGASSCLIGCDSHATGEDFFFTADNRCFFNCHSHDDDGSE